VLAFLRVRIEEQNIDEFWDYIIDNNEKIQSEFDNDAKLVYIVKRAGYNLISIFIIADDPDVIGTFILKDISKHDGVMGFWLLNMIDLKFFHIPPKIPSDWKRYTITFGTTPKELEDVYDALSKMKPSKIITPVYIGLNFHLFGWDCIMMSLLAKDENALQKFITENIKNLEFVEVKQIAQIEKSSRLISSEDLAEYVKTHVLPDGCIENLILDMDEL